MSKTKTKRARRELKREGHRKIAAHHRKAEKAATATAASLTKTSKPMRPNTSTAAAKKQKTSPPDAKQQATPKASIQASQKHNVPFGEYEHILLVGEGDFSFTKSLVVEHGCANVTATSYDTESEVREKYPSFEALHAELADLSPPVPFYHGIDGTKLALYKQLRCRRDDDGDVQDGENAGEGWDTICFMFPHTGGLSTDVNRQVRANQALLVSFFKSCLDTPTPAKRLQVLKAQAQAKAQARARARVQTQTQKQTQTQTQPENATILPPPSPPRAFLRMGGKIIVTLFEGEPYTLWNVRDLARHVGLRVVESWKLDWSQYPAYGHVRTLGTIEGGGAWRGEDRDARVYVFEKIPLVADSDEEKEMGRLGKGKSGDASRSQKGATPKKRSRRESSDDDEDEDE